MRVGKRLPAVELQAVELAQHLAGGSDLDYAPVPAVGDEERAGGEHRAHRGQKSCADGSSGHGSSAPFSTTTTRS